MRTKRILSLITVLAMLFAFVPVINVQAGAAIEVDWTSYKYNGITIGSADPGDTGAGEQRYFVAYGSNGMNYQIQGETYSTTKTAAVYYNSRIATVSFTSPSLKEGEKAYLSVVGFTYTTFGGNTANDWQRLVVSDAVSSSYDKTKLKYDPDVKYYGNEQGLNNANPVKRTSKIDITDFITEGTTTVYLGCPVGGIYIEDLKVIVAKDVTATYTVNGTVVNTVTKACEGEEVAFDEYFYHENGTNTLYHAPAQALSESTTIALTALENTGNYEINDVVSSDGKSYVIKGKNLAPNGDFEYGMAGWYNRANTTPPTTFNVTETDKPAGALRAAVSTGCGGATSVNSIKQAWDIEVGKTYYYSFWAKTGDNWHGFGESDAPNTESQSILANGGFNTGNAWAQRTGVFTATKEYLVLFMGWASVGLADVEIYEVEERQESTDVSVKAALDSINLPLATKTDITLPLTVTDYYDYEVAVSWASSNEEIIAPNGAVTPPDVPTAVTLTPSTTFAGEKVSGESKTVVVFPQSMTGKEYNSGEGIYTIGEENIIAASTAASFEDADGNQSLTGWKSHLGGDTNNALIWIDAEQEVVPDGKWAYAGKWPDAITHASNYCTIDTMWAVEEGTYYLSFYAKKNAGNCEAWVYFSEDDAHHTSVSQIAEEASVSAVAFNAEWTKHEYVIEATSDGYIGFTSHNIGTSSGTVAGTYFDDFELYAAQQAAETLVSVPTVSATATVIAGNAPILPAVIKGTGSLGSNMEVAVEWDIASADFTQAGEVTVLGTVTGTELTTSATVTVLEETFSLGRAVSSGSTNIISFPLPIEDEFVLECDFVIAQVVDAGIHFGFDGSLWGSGAFGISPNGGVLKATGGNGSGTSDGGAVLVPAVKNGETYRLLITVDASTDKFSVTATSADGTVTTVTDRRFRKDHDSINTINFRGNNVGANALGMKNVKVYAPGISKTDYTFVVTKDGATTTEVKGFWTQAEAEASVAEFENYHKEVTVDGTTITVVYTNMTVVKEEIANIAEISDITVFVTDEVVLPETVKVTGTFDTEVDAAILWDAPEEFNAGTTEVTGAISVQFGEQEPIEETVTVKVTVVEEFTLNSFTSAGGQTSGKNDQVLFPVAIKGAFTMQFTANYASFGDLFITIKTKDAGFFGPEQIALGHNNDAGFRPVNGNGAGGRTNADTTIATLETGVDYGFIITTNAAEDKYSVVVYDKATGVVVAEAEDFGYRTNSDAIEAITALTNNGKGSVTISDIKVDTSAVEIVNVTVDGVEKQVVNGNYTQPLTGAALVDEEGNIYAPVDGIVTVPVEEGTVLVTKMIGLEMVNGAQVRVGNTELSEGEKLNAIADSGLRFLAMADYNDTLVADADEFGIKITAEGSDNVVYVKAEKFQNGDETVFSAAITNLNEANYNRKYTAVAYAKLGEIEITTEAVTRSIYQVSAGIMKNGSADAENAPYTVDGVVKNILNAYVNQTGIRLTAKESGITVEEGKYTGDVFFEVFCESDGDDGFNVTIIPDAEWGTPVSIATWWTDYVRFNNNNSVAKGYISDAEIIDGTLTFNFDTTAD